MKPAYLTTTTQGDAIGLSIKPHCARLQPILIYWFIALFACSCDDLFEKDLTDVEIHIVAPTDGSETVPGNVSFLWQEIAGATSWCLTIVSPTFDQATTVVASEVLSDAGGNPPCSFSCTILPGCYQWSLQARNEQYATREYVFSFKVVDPTATEENQPQATPDTL